MLKNNHDKNRFLTQKMNQAAHAIASSTQIDSTVKQQERIATQQATSVSETTTQ